MLNKRHLFINSYSAFLFKFLFPYIKERKCPFRGSVQTIEQLTFFWGELIDKYKDINANSKTVFTDYAMLKLVHIVPIYF